MIEKICKDTVPSNARITFFSSMQIIFMKINHILDHKENLNKFQGISLINSTSQFTWVKNPKKYVKKESGTFNTLLNLQAGKNPVVSDSLQSHGLYSPWNSPDQNTGVSSLSLLQGIFPTQGSNPGLPHCRRILYQLSHQGSPKILEWVA